MMNRNLVLSIIDNDELIQIQTEIRHVTTLDTNRILVGVRFRGVHDSLSSAVRL